VEFHVQKLICEISASNWFCYKEICYDARTHERKTTKGILQHMCISNAQTKLLFQVRVTSKFKICKRMALCGILELYKHLSMGYRINLKIFCPQGT
jgi:hypothetical protein